MHDTCSCIFAAYSSTTISSSSSDSRRLEGRLFFGVSSSVGMSVFYFLSHHLCEVFDVPSHDPQKMVGKEIEILLLRLAAFSC